MKTARWLSGFAALMLALPALASTTTTADAVATIERNARAAHSDAVLVWKDGKALLEPQPETGEEPVHLMSATK
ncbi:MAG: penicillin-binding protein, partial [Lysobacteraceae bacterium]